MFGSKEKIKFNNYFGLWINEKAFTAGTGVIAVLTLTGLYLSTKFVVNLESFYTPLLSALLIGNILGHHIGTSTEKEGKTSSSFWFGASLSLGLVALASFQLSLLSAILLTTALTSFLIHNSGLVVQNRKIDVLMNVFARASKTSLIILGIYHYLMPILVGVLVYVLYDLKLVNALQFLI